MKPGTTFLVLAAGALSLTLSATAPAQAQATRTWVSGVGDDANPCSRTAPCKTFAGAIAKTSPGGEIDALDPGGFGGLTITKAITLDGGGGQVTSVLVSGTNGINVSAGVNDVITLRNLRIVGLKQTLSPGLAGVKFNTGAALIVENCDIFDMSTWGIDFEPSASSALYVLNTVVSDNGKANAGGGIYIFPGAAGTAKGILAGVKAVNNNIGIKVDGSVTSNPTLVSIEDSVSSGAVHTGALANTVSSPVTLMIDRLTSNNNNVGVASSGAGATTYLGNSEISGNVNGVQALSGGSVLSYKTNAINGNTTSDGTPLTSAGLN